MDFSDDHITALATNIVAEIRDRGPFLSLSEFFNRKLLPPNDPNISQSLAGAVESGLLTLSKSSDSPYDDITTAFPDNASIHTSPGKFTNAEVGSAVYGTPGWTRQADLMRPLAPALTARDDTFIIRVYGESSNGGGKAWCEAVVTRTADFVDAVTDNKEEIYSNLSLTNKTLGRKYKIVSFRWLSSDEV